MTADLQRRGLLGSIAGRLPATSLDELRVLDLVLERLEARRDQRPASKPRELHAELRQELLLVRSCCDGRMSPDTDHRAAMKGAIHGTADHMRRGMHEVS